jgi:hypothetical protein
MPYDYEQLVSWHDDVLARPPRGLSSLGVDRDAGMVRLVLSPDHDHAAVQPCSRSATGFPRTPS